MRQEAAWKLPQDRPQSTATSITLLAVGCLGFRREGWVSLMADRNSSVLSLEVTVAPKLSKPNSRMNPATSLPCPPACLS